MNTACNHRCLRNYFVKVCSKFFRKIVHDKLLPGVGAGVGMGVGAGTALTFGTCCCLEIPVGFLWGFGVSIGTFCLDGCALEYDGLEINSFGVDEADDGNTIGGVIVCQGGFAWRR